MAGDLPAAVGQEREAVLQAPGDLRRREGVHARGGQLDGQGDTVDASGDLRYVLGHVAVEGKAGLRRLRPVDEQADRAVALELLRASWVL